VALGAALDRMQQLAAAKARTPRPLRHPGAHDSLPRRCGGSVGVLGGLVEVAGVVL
jgi:hypothetical protein